MVANIFLVVFGYLMPLTALWIFFLCSVPAVARARIERKALMIRDRIVDGIIAGEIEPDNARARDALEFCDYLDQNAEDVTIRAAVTTEKTMARLGVSFDELAQKRASQVSKKSFDNASPRGRSILASAERALDIELSRYMIRGSVLWWYYWPLHEIRTRLVRRATPRAKSIAENIDDPSSGLATDFRQSTRRTGGKVAVLPWAPKTTWRALPHVVDEHDRHYAGMA